MKQHNKFLHVLTVLVSLWLAFYCYYSIHGYVLTEQKALSSLLGPSKGDAVYKKKVDKEHTLLMYRNGEYEECILMSTRLGIWYRADRSISLSMRNPEDSIDYNWSASSNSNGNYDVIFAVKIKDPQIKRVVVSNDGIDGDTSDSEEYFDDTINLASVKMDLVLMNGYGMAYKEITMGESTAFVFRGLDAKGKIIARYGY